MSSEKNFSYIFDEYAATCSIKVLFFFPPPLSNVIRIQSLLFWTTWRRYKEKNPVFYIFHEYAANMQQYAARSIFFSLSTSLSSIQHPGSKNLVQISTKVMKMDPFFRIFNEYAAIMQQLQQFSIFHVGH